MKRALRIFLVCLLLVSTVLSVIACDQPAEGPTGPTGPTGPSDSSGSGDTTTAETCTVSFENTTMTSKSVQKGSSLAKPTDPLKSGFLFVGWYTDAAFTEEASFPLTVNADMKLYARFLSHMEAFQTARENTIGDRIPGFEYTYTMNVTAAYLGIGLSGTNVGTAKYSTVGEVSFYDESVNTGALLNDGSHYQIRRGTTLQKISLDDTGKMTDYAVTQVGADYKYDSSSLAKVIFDYSDDQIESVSPTANKNVYEINASMGASGAASLIAGYVNHPIIEGILGELPATASETKLLVTFDGDRLDSYTYEFAVAISNLTFNLTYTLKFTDVGNAKTIVAKSFENVALTPSEIAGVKNEALSFLTAFKNKTASGYDFTVDTGVDFGATTGEINATFEGSAYRKKEGSKFFFHNDIQIDSDYKNADLYKNKDIEDVHVKLTKLANGEVHIIEKKLLVDATEKLDGFVESNATAFYLFDVLTNSGAYSFAEKTTNGNEITYVFGLTNGGTATLITWLNASLDLDPLNRATTDVLVYGDFDASSLLIDEGTVSVVVKNGALKEINVTVDGIFTTAFEGSADFTDAASAQLKLDMSITANADGDTFEPFETVKAAK